MGLDYQHTCPEIDSNIEHVKSSIDTHLDSLVDELCPFCDENKKKELLESYVDWIYSDLESCFEGVRESNENIRKEADNQIDALTDEISDLEAQIQEI